MRNHRRKIAALTGALTLCVMLAACAPQGTLPSTSGEETSSDAAAEATAFTWTAESDCSTCHDNDVASFDDASCPASQHADMQDQCMTCHNDPAMEKAHEKVTLDSEKKKATLKRTAVTRETCLSCHDNGELAAATAECTALTDKNGTTVNPHDLPANEDHESMNCSSCHKLHTADAPAEAAQATCKNCHHAEVYECGTCHESH